MAKAINPQIFYCAVFRGKNTAYYFLIYRHIYIYREPAPLDAECQLRNRKSGKDVQRVAKQNVVTLEDNDEIVGAQTSNKSVFVATKTSVFAIRVIS